MQCEYCGITDEETRIIKSKKNTELCVEDIICKNIDTARFLKQFMNLMIL